MGTKYELINFSIEPKLNNIITEELGSKGFITFDWFMYTNKDDPNRLSNSKNRLLLFQMFIAQQAMVLLNGDSGMHVDYSIATPKLSLTDEQKTITQAALLALNTDIMKRFMLEDQIMIAKPAKLDLHNNDE